MSHLDCVAGASAQFDVIKFGGTLAAYSSTVVGLISWDRVAALGDARIGAILLTTTIVVALIGFFSRQSIAPSISLSLMLASAGWAAFSLYLLAPRPAGEPQTAVQLGQAVRSIAGVERPESLETRLFWTVYDPDAAATRLERHFADALAEEASRRPLSADARTVSGGVRLSARAGSQAVGQVTATARVALTAEGAPRCDFVISTPSPMPVQTAAERLAKMAIDRAETYVKGSDLC